MTAALLVAVALVVVFTRSTGSPHREGEVFLQAAAGTGPDPFTPSVVQGAPPPATPSQPSPATGNGTTNMAGDTPGLYGGTRNAATCDVEKQITALRADPPKNRAFASVYGIKPSAVPGYLRTLTPLQLTADTLVANHGYRNGSATSYPAVLQAGTAVLVDDHGVPRVRCACGNPLTPPATQQATPTPAHHAWPGYRPSDVVVVTPAPRPVKTFATAHPQHDDRPAHDRGDERGPHDDKTPPPVHSPSTPRPKDTLPKDTSSSETSPSGPSASSDKVPAPPPGASSKPETPPTTQLSPSSAPGTVAPKSSASAPPATTEQQQAPAPGAGPGG